MTDWEKHFRQRRRQNPDFGTVGGAHTIAELKDLIRAHQYSIDQTEAAFNARSFEMSRADQGAYSKWVSDWRLLKMRWDNAMVAANAAINSWHMLPDNLATCEDEYQGILKAVQPSWPELRTTPGDLVDMVSRLKDMGTVADFSQMPQPQSGSDADFEVLKASNQVIDAVKPSSKKTLIYTAIAAGVAGLLLPRAIRLFLPF